MGALMMGALLVAACSAGLLAPVRLSSYFTAAWKAKGVGDTYRWVSPALIRIASVSVGCLGLVAIVAGVLDLLNRN
ncbi:MAG: hypothetical protein J0G30_11975 [Actinomycetales bacterium]|nr:hypothetical protein [Actinomycetales bacterium]